MMINQPILVVHNAANSVAEAKPHIIKVWAYATSWSAPVNSTLMDAITTTMYSKSFVPAFPGTWIAECWSVNTVLKRTLYRFDVGDVIKAEVICPVDSKTIAWTGG